MKILSIISVLTLTLSLNASSWQLLGDKEQNTKQTLQTKNSIVWTKDGKNWSITKPQDNLNLSTITDKDSGYVLINNGSINYVESTYDKTYYKLKKGWNYIKSHEDGVDVEETFEDDSIEFVYVYEDASEAWAGYSPKDKLMTKIQDTRILSLKYIEPKKGFFVLTKKDMKVKIKSTQINSICREKIENPDFDTILDSGVDSEYVYEKRKSIGIKSRYFTHHKQGIYNDTRVMLIYPKLQLLGKKNEMFAYGPAVPKTKIIFNKAYEGKTFYIYDYHTKECYKGILPSLKVPPFSVLKKLK